MNNVLDLLQNHGISPVRVANTKGGEYHSPCPCPADGGGEDRFITWPERNGGKGSFKCRRCDKWGDNIQFLIEFEGLSFREAKQRLGMPDEDWTPPASPVAPKEKKWQPEAKDYSSDIVDLPKWIEHATKFVDKCHEALLEREKALAWLAGRGISLDAVKKWRLGIHVTPDFKNSYRPRSSWGLTGGINPRTKQPLKFVLPAGIVIPWFSADGILRRIRIRLATPDPKFPKKKYHAVVGSAMDSFITTTKARAYTVVETDLDAIMVDEQAGDLTGAMSLGSVAAKPTLEAAHALREADVVLNAIDFDNAGAKARIWWEENFTNSHRHPVPVGKDPGEAFENGADIREWIWLGLPASLKIDDSGAILSSCPARKEEKKTAPAPVEEKPAAAPPAPKPAKKDERPDELRRLAALLSKCPCYIMNSQDCLAVEERQGFDRELHGNMKREIATLLFSEPVMDFLDSTKAGIITSTTIARI